METVLSKAAMKDFAEHLRAEERSKATIEKYLRDLEAFSPS